MKAEGSVMEMHSRFHLTADDHQNETGTTTILVPFETSRASSRRLLMGLVRYAQDKEDWKFYFSEPMYYPKCYTIEAFIANLHELKPHAVFTYVNDPRVVDAVLELGIAAVVIPMAAPHPGVPNLLENWDKTGHMAADYFIGKGYTHFAYAGFKKLMWAEKRRESFIKYISRYGYNVEIYEKLIAVQKHNWKLEDKHMAGWLKKLPKPVGIMCCNDDFAQQLLNACDIASLSVPEEVAILGVDNDELVCETCNPSLSSIALDHNKAGYEIGRLLDDMISGEDCEGRNILLSPIKIVSRKSSDNLAVNNQDVAKAVDYIQEYCKNRNLTVGDVVEHTFVSRRTLEKQFQKHLNCSIYSKIKELRVEYFKTLLIETDMPVYEIALKMGFKEIKHVSKYFQEETGMTPIAFRKKYHHNGSEHSSD